MQFLVQVVGGGWLTLQTPQKFVPPTNTLFWGNWTFSPVYGRTGAWAHCCISSTGPTASCNWVTENCLVHCLDDFFQWIYFSLQRNLVDPFWIGFYTLVGQNLPTDTVLQLHLCHLYLAMCSCYTDDFRYPNDSQIWRNDNEDMFSLHNANNELRLRFPFSCLTHSRECGCSIRLGLLAWQIDMWDHPCALEKNERMIHFDSELTLGICPMCFKIFHFNTVQIRSYYFLFWDDVYWFATTCGQNICQRMSE